MKLLDIESTTWCFDKHVLWKDFFMELINVFASCIYIFNVYFYLLVFVFFSEMYSIYSIILVVGARLPGIGPRAWGAWYRAQTPLALGINSEIIIVLQLVGHLLGILDLD